MTCGDYDGDDDDNYDDDDDDYDGCFNGCAHEIDAGDADDGHHGIGV